MRRHLVGPLHRQEVATGEDRERRAEQLRERATHGLDAEVRVALAPEDEAGTRRSRSADRISTVCAGRIARAARTSIAPPSPPS